LANWHNPFNVVDPTGQTHPLGYFLYHRPHDFVPQYEPLFPLISVLPYRCFGFYGLVLAPLASGVGTVALLYAVALGLRMKVAPYMVWAAGLGTPVALYSVVFWDHSVMMLAAAASLYYVWRAFHDGDSRWSIYAGGVLGAGVFVHELLLAMFLSVFVSLLPLLPTSYGRKLLIGLLCGFLPVFLLWMAANQLVCGSVWGPHLSANMGGNVADHPYGLNQVLDIGAFVDRAQEELLGKVSAVQLPLSVNAFSIFAILLAAYFYVSLAFGSAFKLLPVMWVIAAGVAVYLVHEMHWADGLFEATPLVIPALAAPWFAERVPVAESTPAPATPGLSESLFIAWVSRTSWIFLLISIGNPMLPGVDWGARYLLPVLPYLVVMSAYALDRQYSAGGPQWKKAVAACMILLVGMSVYCQAEGLVMVQRNILYNRDLNNKIAAVRTAAVVYSNIGIGPEAAADVHMDKIQFMVRSNDDWFKFRQIMRDLKLTDFTFVGSNQDLSALTEDATDRPDGQVSISFVGSARFNPSPDEDGSPVVLVHYRIRPDPADDKAAKL
jgi:hypothetical protein